MFLIIFVIVLTSVSVCVSWLFSVTRPSCCDVVYPVCNLLSCLSYKRDLDLNETSWTNKALLTSTLTKVITEIWERSVIAATKSNRAKEKQNTSHQRISQGVNKPTVFAFIALFQGKAWNEQPDYVNRFIWRLTKSERTQTTRTQLWHGTVDVFLATLG